MRIVIRRVSITASSAIEARRLADALPGALERALTRVEAGTTPAAPSRARPADRVAADVAAAVAVRIERSRSRTGDAS